MRLTGNINDIKQKRDSKNEGIAIEIDKIEYITYKKDGKYYQPFDFVQELDTPFIITGDQLAKINTHHLEEGELEFQVYDKVGDAYELNPDKKLAVTIAHDFDINQTLLTFVAYTVIISIEEFKKIKTASSNAKKQQKGKGRKG